MSQTYKFKNAPGDYSDEDLVHAYIKDPKGRGHVSTAWASPEMHDLVLEDPERAWRIIVGLSAQKLNPEVAAVVAAGPLENMLGLYGAEIIDRVELLAKSSLEFNHLLALVWQSEIDDVLWKRILAACKPIYLAANPGQGITVDHTMPRAS
jgi:hypothetical protein